MSCATPGWTLHQRNELRRYPPTCTWRCLPSPCLRLQLARSHLQPSPSQLRSLPAPWPVRSALQLDCRPLHTRLASLSAGCGRCACHALRVTPCPLAAHLVRMGFLLSLSMCWTQWSACRAQQAPSGLCSWPAQPTSCLLKALSPGLTLPRRAGTNEVCCGCHTTHAAPVQIMCAVPAHIICTGRPGTPALACGVENSIAYW